MFLPELKRVLYRVIEPTGLNSVDEQGTWVLVVRGIQSVSSLLISVLVVRLYGIEAAGTLAIAMFVSPLITHLSSSGLQSSLPRNALPVESNASIALIISFAMLPVVAVLSGVYSWIMSSDTTEGMIIGILALGGFFTGQRSAFISLLLLDRRAKCAVLPIIVTTVCIAVSGFVADTFFEFSIALLFSWFLGHVLLIATMSYNRVSRRQLLGEWRQGVKYVPTDLSNSAAEEVGPMVLTLALSREELGLFGLTRQLVRMAETLAWALGQVWYVNIIKARGFSRELLRAVRRLSLLATGGVGVGSAFLAVVFYGLPVLWPLSWFLAVSVPSRYSMSFLELMLRADGEVLVCTRLSLYKLLAALVLVPGLGALFGIWGAVGALVAMAVVSERVYVWVWNRLHPSGVPIR